jgi:predicted transcriptional regulator
VQGLGELEARVMDILWSASEPLAVRDVLGHMTSERELAYTTVMTVLDNLHRKGLVEREKAGRAYRYRPTSSREERAAHLLRDLLNDVPDPQAVLLHFARIVSDEESDVLRKALRRRKST